MDFDYIEDLVIKCKNNDIKSKERLAEQFKPLILNLSKKCYIHGYTIYDLQNECYSSLFYCVRKYNIETHRFVSYATAAIKNNLYALIKKNKSRSIIEGSEALTFSENIEDKMLIDPLDIEELICNKDNADAIRHAVENLDEEDKELIEYVFFKGHTVKEYSIMKRLNYSTAVLRKNGALDKLIQFFSLI